VKMITVREANLKKAERARELQFAEHRVLKVGLDDHINSIVVIAEDTNGQMFAHVKYPSGEKVEFTPVDETATCEQFEMELGLELANYCNVHKTELHGAQLELQIVEFREGWTEKAFASLLREFDDAKGGAAPGVSEIGVSDSTMNQLPPPPEQQHDDETTTGRRESQEHGISRPMKTLTVPEQIEYLTLAAQYESAKEPRDFAPLGRFIEQVMLARGLDMTRWVIGGDGKTILDSQDL